MVLVARFSKLLKFDDKPDYVGVAVSDGESMKMDNDEAAIISATNPACGACVFGSPATIFFHFTLSLLCR